MQISGRVTHSFFCFLNQNHFDTSKLYELTDLDMEFIKDPSAWLPAESVENLIQKISDEYGPHFSEGELTSLAGHHAFQLKAWGDLDRVLTLGLPLGFYKKIENILQWFISPFSAKNLKYTEHMAQFECELSSQKYPYIVDYMRSALEALPLYQSEEMTKVTWEGELVQINYPALGQMSLDIELGESLKPEVLQRLKNAVFCLEQDYLKQKQVSEEQKARIRSFTQEQKDIIKRLHQMEHVLTNPKNPQEKKLYHLIQEAQKMYEQKKGTST